MLETQESWVIVAVKAWLQEAHEAGVPLAVAAALSNFPLQEVPTAVVLKGINQISSAEEARAVTPDKALGTSRATGASRITSKMSTRFNSRWVNSASPSR